MTARLFIFGKIIAYTVIRDKYFKISLQFSIQKPYLNKNMYFSNFEFINLFMITCIWCLNNQNEEQIYLHDY